MFRSAGTIIMLVFLSRGLSQVIIDYSLQHFLTLILVFVRGVPIDLNDGLVKGSFGLLFFKLRDNFPR